MKNLNALDHSESRDSRDRDVQQRLVAIRLLDFTFFWLQRRLHKTTSSNISDPRLSRLPDSDVGRISLFSEVGEAPTRPRDFIIQRCGGTNRHVLLKSTFGGMATMMEGFLGQAV